MYVVPHSSRTHIALVACMSHLVIQEDSLDLFQRYITRSRFDKSA